MDDAELLQYILQFREPENASPITILEPDSLSYTIPEVSTVQITGAGIIDGKLRLQIYQNYDENATTAYDFYLMDAQGNRIDGEKQFTYGFDAEEGFIPGSNYYWEYEFDIDPAALSDYRVMADIRESTKYPGRWSVTVQTEETALEAQEYAIDCDFGTFRLTSASLSHFGVDFSGEGTVYGDFDWWAFTPTIIYDGEPIELSLSGSNYSEAEEENPPIGFHCISPIPLDPEKVEGILLMGEPVALTPQ